MSTTQHDIPSTYKASQYTRIPQLFRRFSLPRMHLMGLAAVTSCLSWWTSYQQPHAWLAITIYIAAMAVLAYYYGRSILAWLGNHHFERGGLCLILLCGLLIEGGLAFVLDCFLPCGMQWNFAIVTSLGLLITLASPAGLARQSRQAQFYELFTWLIILTSTAACTQEARPYAKVTEQDITIKVWSDFLVFSHYSGLLSLDPTLHDLGEPEYGGSPLPMYHFGSFIYSAGLEYSSGISALDAVLGLWFPLSFVLLGCSAYAIAAMRWNAWSGLCAAFAIMWLPDISRWGIGLNYYSFHGLLAISPGLNYGIALTTVAVIILTVPQNLTWRNYLLLAYLMLLTVAFKAHFFIVGVPLLFSWWLMTRDGWSRRTKWLIGISSLAAAAAVFYVADARRIGPTIWPLGYPAFEFRIRVLDTLSSEAAQGNWWKQLLQQLVHAVGPFRVLLAVFVVLVSVFGAWLVVFPALVWWSRRTPFWNRIDWIPVLVTLWFVVFAFATPRNQTGAGDEIWHRPFVWAYFMTLAWSCGFIARLFLKTAPVKLAAIAAMCLTCAGSWNAHSVLQSRLAGSGTSFSTTVIPVGLSESCKYIREHAAASDIVYGQEYTMFSLIGGLTERCVYLGRSDRFFQKFRITDSPKELLTKERMNFLEAMRAATTLDELKQMQKQSGIRWFLASPQEALAWPETILRHPEFQFDNYRVYDLQNLPAE